MISSITDIVLLLIRTLQAKALRITKLMIVKL